MNNEEIIAELKRLEFAEDIDSNAAAALDEAIARLSATARTVYELWGTNQGQEIHYFTEDTPHEMKALLKRVREGDDPRDMRNYKVIERTTVETVKEW